LKKLELGRRIRESWPYKKVRSWAQSNSLPGFEGLPIYSVFDFIRAELKKDNILIRANAMAFSFFIALFPSILVLFTLLPYLPIQDLTTTVKESIDQLLPGEAALYLQDVIDTLTTDENSGLLSFSLFLTLLFASNGMLTMLRGFDKSYEITYKSRSTFGQRLVALKLTFIVGGIFIFSLIAIVAGRIVMDILLDWTQIDSARYYAILITRWFAMFFLFYGGISVAYRYGPAMKNKIKLLSPGAMLATILSLLSSIAFSYYVSKFGRYNELYGSLGAIIVLMLWIQINSLIILIGYELNASIKINKDMVEIMSAPIEATTEEEVDQASEPPQR